MKASALVTPTEWIGELWRTCVVGGRFQRGLQRRHRVLELQRRQPAVGHVPAASDQASGLAVRAGQHLAAGVQHAHAPVGPADAVVVDEWRHLLDGAADDRDRVLAIAGVHPGEEALVAGGQTVLFRPLIKFSQPTYSVNENGSFVTITVVRSGDTNPAVTVDYSTPDDSAALTFLPCSNANGVASPRCDFTTALGTLKFGPGETSKTFTALISQDTWVEGNETVALTLSNPTGGAAFQQPSDANAVLTIVDDDLTPPTTNAIDDSNNFVRQHYHDFLSREPDAPGFSFWTNQIESCGADAQCRAASSKLSNHDLRPERAASHARTAFHSLVLRQPGSN